LLPENRQDNGFFSAWVVGGPVFAPAIWRVLVRGFRKAGRWLENRGFWLQFSTCLMAGRRGIRRFRGKREPCPTTWAFSALETAANEWQRSNGEPVDRLQEVKPELFAYLSGLSDDSILKTVAEGVADSLGITKKFVGFVQAFRPGPPQRPTEGFQFPWDEGNWAKALKTIYRYRSKALHDGIPFPASMCSPPTRLPDLGVSAEIPTARAHSEKGATWIDCLHRPLLIANEFLDTSKRSFGCDRIGPVGCCFCGSFPYRRPEPFRAASGRSCPCRRYPSPIRTG
jgi:hypothetical protein